jgi:hypothetical protein
LINILDQKWLNLQYHENTANDKHDESGTAKIKKPNELENEMEDPPGAIDPKLLDRIQGSIIGMALGDALGAHVEFRPHQYVKEHPVTGLEGGGTWGLEKGQVLLFHLTLQFSYVKYSFITNFERVNNYFENKIYIHKQCLFELMIKFLEINFFLSKKKRILYIFLSSLTILQWLFA